MSSPSVLVIRLDAIGDALALTPLLAAFRDRDVPVDLVMTEANAEVFTARAARSVFIAPFALRSSSRENVARIDAFAATLRDRRYSHVLVATEDPGGYRLARSIGAPVRVGFSNGLGKPFKTLWVRAMLTETIVRSAGFDPKAPHECEVLFALARGLLGDATPARDVAQLRPLVLDSEPPVDARVVFQVTNKWERLGMPMDDVVKAYLLARERASLRLVASSRENSFADRFASAVNAAVDIFDTLEPWKEAIAAGAALIAPDSGGIHVAGMTGTPTLAVFDRAAPFTLQSARWTPWAAPCVNLRGAPGWYDSVPWALDQLLNGTRRAVDTVR